jgi:hypothetical protein
MRGSLSKILCKNRWLVEPSGIEPLTSCMPSDSHAFPRFAAFFQRVRNSWKAFGFSRFSSQTLIPGVCGYVCEFPLSWYRGGIGGKNLRPNFTS